MDPSDLSDVRVMCAESGHWWDGDALWNPHLGANGWTRRRVQRCQRDGCERERTMHTTMVTCERVGYTQYAGNYQKTGFLYREELRREQLARQIQSGAFLGPTPAPSTK